MITHYQFGSPLPTGAVATAVPVTHGPLPGFTPCEGGWQRPLAERDIVYGLGEAPRGINKRGWLYTSHCADDPRHTEDKHSLYGAHNFLLVQGKETFGLFLDCASDITYDIGYTAADTLKILPQGRGYSAYHITAPTPAEICKELRRLTGQSYIPPKWAFGFGQSRWGYQNEADIRRVAKEYRQNGLPLDSIYLDIDYMKKYADFTVDTARFPDLPGLARELKAEGIHLVPIIDAGIKVDENDPTYREGRDKGYYCKTKDGRDFVGAVWPGHVCFADFLRPEVRRWFGEKYRFLLDQGIEGFWNDMNEPAIFYTPERLDAVLDEVAQAKGKNLGVREFFALQGKVEGLANNPADYREFYSTVEGEQVTHEEVHNLYGANMTRAAGETFSALCPDRRILLFSRASSIGSHRYGGIWLGDNCSWWSHLLQNIRQMPSVQMCGYLFAGADLGGFGGDTTEDLVLRWTAFGIFTPLMRNHAAEGTREQECFAFPHKETFRNLLGIRYGLLPYLYSEFMKAALSDGLYFRPLAFDYPDDPRAAEVEDQLLLGEGLMIAPVYTQNAAGRCVYLPERMKLLRLRSMADYDTEILEPGWQYVACGLAEVLLFIRPGHLVPVAKPADCVAALDETQLTLWGYAAENCRYTLYTDDGETTDYANPAHRKILSGSYEK